MASMKEHTPIWASRGSSFIRRLNSERIAEDPRLRSIIDSVNSPKEAEDTSPCDVPLEHKKRSPIDSASSSALQQSHKNRLDMNISMVHGTSPKMGAVRMNPSQWGRPLKRFFQMNIDPSFIHVTSRVLILSPECLDAIFKWVSPGNSSADVNAWKPACDIISSMNLLIQNKFGNKACVFDCGLYDCMRKLWAQPEAIKFQEEVQTSSLPFERGALPRMHSVFVVSSAISSWLDLSSENIAIVLAPSHSQLAVVLASSVLYCSHFTENFPTYGETVLRWYLKEIEDGGTGFSQFIQRNFSPQRSHSAESLDCLSRAQHRFVLDFTILLNIRDAQFANYCQDNPSKPMNLLGMTVFPHYHDVTFAEIILHKCKKRMTKATEGSYRPYFVIYNSKSQVEYSSMVHGIRELHLTKKMYKIPINRRVSSGDLLLKMYHFPPGKRGEFVLECRLHTGVLEKKITGYNKTTRTFLRLSDGDFDVVSNVVPPPVDFTIELIYQVTSDEEGGIDDNRSINAVVDEEEQKEQEIGCSGPSTTAQISNLNETSSSGEQEETWSESDLNRLKEIFPDAEDRLLQQCFHAYRRSRDPLARVADYIIQHGLSAPASRASQITLSDSFSTEDQEESSDRHSSDVRRFSKSILITKDIRVILPLYGTGKLRYIHLRGSKFVGRGEYMTSEWQENQRNGVPDFFISLEVKYNWGKCDFEECDMPADVLRIPEFIEARAKLISQWIQFEEECEDELPAHARSLRDNSLLYGPLVAERSVPSSVSAETESSETASTNGIYNNNYNYRRYEVDYSGLDMRHIDLGELFRPLQQHLMRTCYRGASDLLISQLPTSTYKRQGDEAADENSECLVCRFGFEDGDTVKYLPCFHRYHADCIDPWLRINKVCPVCQRRIDVEE